MSRYEKRNLLLVDFENLRVNSPSSIKDFVIRAPGNPPGTLRVWSRLGAGAFSTVHKSTKQNGVAYALKVLEPSYYSNSKMVSQFLFECALVHQIDHTHIVSSPGSGVYTSESVDGQEQVVWIAEVLEYGGRETAARLISRQAELPLDEAARIVRDIGRALVYLKSKGIVHRDVKPDNILHNGTLFSKLTDFSIACSTCTSGFLIPGPRIGTPLYMAPEQVHNSDMSYPVDVYALGWCWYEMIARRHPFIGSEYEIYQQQLTADPGSAFSQVSEREQWMDDLITHMMQKNYLNRPAIEDVVSTIESKLSY